MNAGAVPKELRNRAQWLLWSAGSDPPKRPLTAEGYGASWNDPSEWMEFDEALELAKTDEFDGVGFVIAEGDPYVGLDLDGCLREPFQEKPKDWLPSLADFEGTYVEYSQSGIGLHPFVRDVELPGWWSDSHFTDDEHEGVEAYTSKFFIVTGRPVEALSGPTVQEVDVEPFLLEAYESINGQEPTAFRAQEADDYDGSDDWLDIDGVRDALGYVDPDVDYPTWRNIGFAVHDFDAGSTGRKLFEDWSRGGTKWDSKAERSVEAIWKGAKQGAGVTTGTLVHHARDGGWSGPQRGLTQPRANGGETAAADGGTATATSAAPEPPEPSTPSRFTTGAIIARAGYDPEEDSLSDLTSSEAAQAIERILDEHDGWDFLVVDDPTEDIYSFQPDDGVWHRDGERRLKQVCREAMGAQNSKRAHAELVYAVQGNPGLQIDREELGAPDGTIATPDGLLDLLDRTVEPLEPGHLALNRITASYDETASYEGTRWEEFLEESVDDFDMEKLQEYAGYCLWHHAQPHGKALFLVGPTNSGKGTFLKAISQVIGGENISHESLRDLLDSRWGPARLFGKMANVRNEVTAGGLKKVEKFKEVTGGEDTLSAEYKGKDKFDFRVTQKFMFATNQMPDIEHADGAFFNRLLFVSFPNTVPDEDQDKGLLDELADESSAILNWMLDGLKRLMRQSVFTNERSRDNKEAMLKEHGSSVDRFVHNALEVTGDADDVVSKKDLYALYTRFCDFIGRDPEVQQTFTTELKSVNGVDDGQSRRVSTGKGRTDVYKGIQVIERACHELQVDVPEHATADGHDGGGTQNTLG